MSSSSARVQFLFELVDGELMPRLPHNLDGSKRVADGERLLTIEQASKRSGLAVDRLRSRWLAQWSDYIRPTDEITTEPRAAAAESDEDDVVPEPADMTPAVAAAGASLDVLHAVKYPSFNDEHFAYYVEQCRQRGLNPWSNHLVAELRHDPGRRELKLILITTIDAARILAHRTGEMDGSDVPQWCGEDGVWRDVWTKIGAAPVAARVKIWRKGAMNGFVGIAHLAEFSPLSTNGVGDGLDEDAADAAIAAAGYFYDTMPAHMIAKCAEMLALRKSFPDVFEGLYLREELDGGDRRPPAGAAAAGRSFDPREPERESHRPEPDLADDMTPQQYDLALVELGFNTPAKRSAVKGLMRARMPKLAAEHESAFFHAAVREIWKNPAAYGATLPDLEPA